MILNKIFVPGFDWAIGLNRMILGVLGIWPDKGTLFLKVSKQIRIPLILLMTAMWLTLPMFCAVTKVIGDLQLMIDNFTTSITCVTVAFKLNTLWINRKGKKSVNSSEKKVIF